MLRQRPNSICLFDFDLGAGRFDLFLDLSAFCLGHAFLDRLGRAFDKRFRFRQAEPGTALRTSLITPILFAPISFRITSNVVFSSAAGAAAPPLPPQRARRDRHRSRCADAPFFFELLHQSSNLQNGQAAELLHYFICICHFVFPPVAASESLRRIKADSHRLGQFVVCVGSVRQTDIAVPVQNSYAPPRWLRPSFSAFAFNSRANAAAGSIQQTAPDCVAGDNSSPSNCASKISRDGRSANVSNSAVESTARSTTPILSAAILNSAANVFKIFATGATSARPSQPRFAR